MAIKEIVLDDSILDLDSWLPKEAVEQIVQIISNQKNIQITKKRITIKYHDTYLK